MKNTPHDISHEELLDWLKTNEIFGQFSDAVLQELLAESEWLLLSEGEVLFRQGDGGGFFCLVHSGSLTVTITQRDGTVDTLSTVAQGMTVGEIQFLSGGTRTATVSAMTGTRLIKITKKTFDGIAHTFPEVLQKFAEIIRKRLRRSQLFEVLPSLCGPIDQDLLNYIESEIEWVHLSFGQALFHQGDPGTDLFLLISGRLQVSVRDKAGFDRKVAEINKSEIVGEMAMFTGDKRTASIYAMRDSDLVRISREAFERIINSHPGIMMYFIQFLIKRMQDMATSSKQLGRTLNIAVVPAGVDAPLADFSGRLVQSLATYGKTLRLNSNSVDSHWGVSGMAQNTGTTPNSIRLTSWLDEQVNSYTNIVYEADPTATPWTMRCLQNADRILIVARADGDPLPGKLERALFASDSEIHTAHHILILIHADGSRLPSGTDRWLQERQVESHYHVRWDKDADFHRLARILTGNAVGLVLGGGGARGLAHIGVIRALNEAGIPIDMIGGTSMGAMISSLYAMGKDYQGITAAEKEAIANKPFTEFTLPLISLIRSKRLDNSVKSLYGDITIEDLWLNYFSISSNLTTAEMIVHRKGNLGKSVRASAALPGIVRPVIEDNCLLVDGGLFNNIPADIMKEICGGYVIMVNVSPDEDLRVADEHRTCPSNMEMIWSHLNPLKKKIVFPRIHDIMMRTITVGSARELTRTSKAADFSFRPPVDHFGLLEFDSIDAIVDAGYRYAMERIDELQMRNL